MEKRSKTLTGALTLAAIILSCDSAVAEPVKDVKTKPLDKTVMILKKRGSTKMGGEEVYRAGFGSYLANGGQKFVAHYIPNGRSGDLALCLVDLKRCDESSLTTRCYIDKGADGRVEGSYERKEGGDLDYGNKMILLLTMGGDDLKRGTDRKSLAKCVKFSPSSGKKIDSAYYETLKGFVAMHDQVMSDK